MSEPTSTTSPITPPAPPSVTSHIPCFACGYDLHGLPHDALCPECGRPVVHSLNNPVAARWGFRPARKIRRGVKLLTFCEAYFVLGTIVCLIFPPIDFPLLLAFIGLWQLLTLIAWWMTATPPTPIPGNDAPRRLAPLCWTIRLAGLASLLIAPAGMAMISVSLARAYGGTLPSPLGEALLTVFFFTTLATIPLRFVCGMLLIRARLPRTHTLARSACQWTIAAGALLLGAFVALAFTDPPLLLILLGLFALSQSIFAFIAFNGLTDSLTPAPPSPTDAPTP